MAKNLKTINWPLLYVFSIIPFEIAVAVVVVISMLEYFQY